MNPFLLVVGESLVTDNEVALDNLVDTKGHPMRSTGAIEKAITHQAWGHTHYHRLKYTTGGGGLLSRPRSVNGLAPTSICGLTGDVWGYDRMMRGFTLL